MNLDAAKLLVRLADHPDTLAQELASQLRQAVAKIELLEREAAAFEQYRVTMDKFRESMKPRQGAEARS